MFWFLLKNISKYYSIGVRNRHHSYLYGTAQSLDKYELALIHLIGELCECTCALPVFGGIFFSKLRRGRPKLPFVFFFSWKRGTFCLYILHGSKKCSSSYRFSTIPVAQSMSREMKTLFFNFTRGQQEKQHGILVYH